MALLLHSLAELDEILLALVDRCAPRSILEIGSESGGFSKTLHQRCQDRGAQLVTIEPAPTPEIVALASASETLHLHVCKSLPYLLEHGCSSDFVFVDGDHNWFTVYNELTLVHRAWMERGATGTIVLHDVSWPNARRDAYYDPAAMPPEAVHPYTFVHGVTLDDDGIIDGGFRGAGAFAWAVHAGGPCNGVLTAVEDFMEDNPGWSYRSVDAVFGLGVLTRTGSSEDAIAEEVFAPYQNALVGRLERNRLALYLKVLEQQDALTSYASARRTA